MKENSFSINLLIALLILVFIPSCGVVSLESLLPPSLAQATQKKTNASQTNAYKNSGSTQTNTIQTNKIENVQLPTHPTSTSNELELVDLGLSVKWANLDIAGSGGEGYFGLRGVYYDYPDLQIPYEVTAARGDDGKYEPYYTFSGTDYDPAYTITNHKMRTPTTAEWKELVAKCKIYTGEYGGRIGFWVIGPNGNSIFLCADGYFEVGHQVYHENDIAGYWASDFPATPVHNDVHANAIFFENKVYADGLPATIEWIGESFNQVWDLPITNMYYCIRPVENK